MGGRLQYGCNAHRSVGVRPWCEMSLKLAGPQLFGEGRRVLAESTEVRGSGGAEGPCVCALRRHVQRAGEALTHWCMDNVGESIPRLSCT